MVRELLSIKEQSQLLVKETSGRLGNDFICLTSFLSNNFGTLILLNFNLINELAI